MKKILLFALLMLLVPVVTASSYNFEQGKNINLKTICYDIDNNFCIATTKCNITIWYENNSLLVDNQPMSYNPNYYNYTLTSSQTKKIGNYFASVICVGNTTGSSTFSFEITPTGSTLSIAQGIVYIIFLVAIIFLFSLSLYGSIKIPWSNGRTPDGRIISINDMRYLKLFLIVVSYLLLMFMTGITQSIMTNFLFLQGAGKVFNWLYWILFSMLWPVIVVSIIVGVATWLGNLKIKKSLERGVPLR